MSAVWDKIFGNSQPPANDSPRLLRIAPDEPSRAADATTVDYASDRKSNGQGNLMESLPNSVVVGRTFDSIGRRNESLRSQLDAIEFAFSNIESIRAHFHDILQPIDQVLQDIERTKTDHREAERKLEALTSAHDQIKGDHAALGVERDALSLKHEEASLRARDLEQSLRIAEAGLTEARASLVDRNAKVDRVERELEDSKRRLLMVSDQLPALRAEFNAKEKRLQEVEQIRATLQDQHNLLTQENRSLRARIEELVGNTSKLNRQLSETESRHVEATRRVGELEAALQQETASHAKLRTTHFDDVETHRLNLSNLREELNSMNARSEAAERLLADSRNELRERNSTIRALEQQSMEGSLMVQARERSIADMERDLAATRTQLAEVEAARAALLERSTDLVKALETRDGTLQRAEQKIAALDARLSDQARIAASERDLRDERINKLREQLEAESAARAFAEGALQSARQERAGWPRDTEAKSAAREDEPATGESGRDKVTRLRG